MNFWKKEIKSTFFWLKTQRLGESLGGGAHVHGGVVAAIQNAQPRKLCVPAGRQDVS